MLDQTRPGTLLILDPADQLEPLVLLSPSGERLAALPVARSASVWVPSWSPDGNAVVWAESADDRSWELVLARLAFTGNIVETAMSRVALPGRPDHVTFGAGPAEILVLTPGPNGFGLWHVDLDDDEPEARQLESGAPLFTDMGPDGRLVAHIGNETRVLALTRAGDGLPTTDSQLIDRSGAPYQTPSWHPDGGSIFYARTGVRDDDGPTYEVLRHHLADDEVEVLFTYRTFAMFAVDPTGRRMAVSVFDDRNDQEAPAPSVPGQEVAFSPRQGSAVPVQDASSRAGVWLVELEDAAAERLGTTPLTSPTWDPGGRWILGRDRLTGQGSWRAISIDDPSATIESPEHFLAPGSLAGYYLQFWDQFARTQTVWAPDSSGFAFPAIIGGRSVMWLQDLDGGTPGRLGQGGVAFWGPEPADP